MAFVVLLTAGAEQDLEDIYDYIADSDSPVKIRAANSVVGRTRSTGRSDRSKSVEPLSRPRSATFS